MIGWPFTDPFTAGARRRRSVTVHYVRQYRSTISINHEWLDRSAGDTLCLGSRWKELRPIAPTPPNPPAAPGGVLKIFCAVLDAAADSLRDQRASSEKPSVRLERLLFHSPHGKLSPRYGERVRPASPPAMSAPSEPVRLSGTAPHAEAGPIWSAALPHLARGRRVSRNHTSLPLS